MHGILPSDFLVPLGTGMGAFDGRRSIVVFYAYEMTTFPGMIYYLILEIMIERIPSLYQQCYIRAQLPRQRIILKTAVELFRPKSPLSLVLILFSARITNITVQSDPDIFPFNS